MNPLSQLKDIHLPKAISFWPLAPGWYLLLALIIILIAIGLFVLYKRKKKQRLPKAILHELADIQQLSDHEAITAASSLLKRIALSFYPRDDVAKLQGSAWLEFLDKAGKTNQFTRGSGQILITGPYQKQAKADVVELTHLVESWIKHHV